MSKTHVYDRFDATGTRIMIASPDGYWVKAEDAINREAVLQAEIRTLQVQLKEAKSGASFEFDHGGITQTVRGSNEAIKALLAWRKRQEMLTNNALRMVADARHKSRDAALEEAARECDRLVNQAAKFNLGPQSDCAAELARNIRELKEQV